MVICGSSHRSLENPLGVCVVAAGDGEGHGADEGLKESGEPITGANAR